MDADLPGDGEHPCAALYDPAISGVCMSEYFAAVPDEAAGSRQTTDFPAGLSVVLLNLYVIKVKFR